MTNDEKLAKLKVAEELGKRSTDSNDLDELKAIAMKMLRVLWETDDDPNKGPWPGGESS